MALSLKAAAQVELARDSAFLQLLFKDSVTFVDGLSFAEGSSKKVDIADSTTYTVDLDGVVTGGFLWVSSTRQVELQVTSALGTDQSIQIGNSVTDTGFFFQKGTFTAVKIINNSGDVANVAVAFAGS